MDEGKVHHLLFYFAMPAMVGMIAGAIYNIVDRIFVGQYIGPDGLAAITLCFPIMLLMGGFSITIGAGGSSRVAILRGAHKTRAAEQALAHSFMLLAVVGIIGIVLSFCGVDLLLWLSGATEATLPMARAYLRIILLGAPLALIGQANNSLVRACGSPRYAMATQIIGAVSNGILDAVFIGYMGMGVEGAALGTVLGQGLASLFGISFFLSAKSPLHIRLPFFVRPRFRIFQRILAVGSAPFFINMSFVVYMTLMNRMIYEYGGKMGLSALGVFFSIDSLLFLPAMAIGEASQPIIGYNYGAGNPDRVIKTVKSTIMAVTGLYIVSFLMAEIFAAEMIRLFNNSPELLAIGVPGMRIGYLGIMFVGFPIVTNFALLGLGKARASILFSFFRIGVMFIPLLILPKFWGLWGIWASFPIGDTSGAVMSFFILRWLVRWLRSPAALEVN